MNSVSNIIKSLIMPVVIKYSTVAVPDKYWDQFAHDFIHFETNAAPVYKSLYDLQLIDPEHIFEQLPGLYANFIKELAEEHVLGNKNEFIESLIASQNELFLKEVVFLSTMQSVIKKAKKEQLKKELPIAFDRLTFELDEDILAAVIKKKSREDLRNKLKKWKEDSVPQFQGISISQKSQSQTSLKLDDSNSEDSKPKTISLSWVKYAVAASIILCLGIWFNNYSPKDYSRLAKVSPSKKSMPDSTTMEKIQKISPEFLAEITSVSNTTRALTIGLGYGQNEKKIIITTNNQRERRLSIQKAIDNREIQLKAVVSSSNPSSTSAITDLKSNIASLKDQLQKLNEKEKQYLFDGKTLTLFTSAQPEEIKLLLLNDQNYYLKKKDQFFKLLISKDVQFYERETNSDVLKALDKIIYTNVP